MKKWDGKFFKAIDGLVLKRINEIGDLFMLGVLPYKLEIMSKVMGMSIEKMRLLFKDLVLFIILFIC